MNTAVSTKRAFVPSRNQKARETKWLIAMIAGLAVLLMGVSGDNAVFAAVGVAASASAFLYFNGRIWVGVLRNVKR